MTRVGSLVFYFLCWPGMVLNQRQLSIVVSDWGSYLDSLFPPVVCGIFILYCCVLALQSCMFRFVSLSCFVPVIINKKWLTYPTLHLGPTILPTTIVTLCECLNEVQLYQARIQPSSEHNEPFSWFRKIQERYSTIYCLQSFLQTAFSQKDSLIKPITPSFIWKNTL